MIVSVLFMSSSNKPSNSIKLAWPLRTMAVGGRAGWPYHSLYLIQGGIPSQYATVPLSSLAILDRIMANHGLKSWDLNITHLLQNVQTVLGC